MNNPARRRGDRWRAPARAAYAYGVQLRRVARAIDDIVRGIAPNGSEALDPGAERHILDLLERYSEILRPWAERVAQRMIQDVATRDFRAWQEAGREMGVELRREIETAPTGVAMRQALVDQVDLITSLPRDAAERVHHLTTEARITGRRAEDIAKEILASGDVSRARANTIARTEVMRTGAELLKARAQHIGAESYVWRTAQDADVRPDHRVLNGKVFRWDSPPIADRRAQVRAHPGSIYNCFPGDVLVTPLGGYRRAFRAFYSGPLTILRVANTFLRVTPNHPILTARGWMAACCIQKGDYVIQAAGQGADTIEEDVNHRLLTFEEVFEAGSSDVESLFVNDFHGDVVEGEIEIVRPKLNLARDEKAVLLHRVGQNVISLANRWVGSVWPDGGDSQILQSLRSSGGDISPMLFGRSRFGEQTIGFSLTAQDTCLLDNPMNRGSTNAVTVGEFDLFSTSKVRDNDIIFRQLGPVVSCETSRFSGHVYTLETDHGYYGATSAKIIAKNCRCIAIPVLDPSMFMMAA